MHRLLSTVFVLLAGTAFAADDVLFKAAPLTGKGQFTGGIEGPACDAEGSIYCVKFGGEHTLGKTSPDGKAELFVTLPEGSTANGIRLGPDGFLYVADYTGHNVLKVNRQTGAVVVWAHEATLNQPNDLAILDDGSFYASDPDWKAGTGQIWRISREGKFSKVAADMGTTNGIDVSPDGKTLYVNESVQRKVWAFSIEADGALANKRLIKEFPDFGFDGMRVDVKGNLYITRHGKGTVVKLSPKGEILKEITLPGKNPSNICFGGPDGRTAYVTEMENGQLVQFRVDQPGLEWQRLQDWHAAAAEKRPTRVQAAAAVRDVCAWPNLTTLRDGTIVAILHNQPGHGTMEGDIDCWASTDGLKWEKRSTITRHVPHTIRMNHAAGLAANGDLLVLCSGWTDVKQPERPKQDAFRDNILSNWVLRSADGGRTWTQHENFPAPESGWTHYIPFGDLWARDGALYTSCYHGQFVDATKSSKTKGYRSWLFRSDDDGASWKAVSIIGARHNETDLFPLGEKKWLAAARVEAMDLFLSLDDGVTWLAPMRVTGRNEINGHLTRLKDGRLLLTYGVRVARQHGVRAKFSSDDGANWSDPIRVAHSHSWDCGYPSSVQLPSGEIVTAFYSKDSPLYSGYHMGVTVWTP